MRASLKLVGAVGVVSVMRSDALRDRTSTAAGRSR
jgi:hypothetical protein